MFKCQKCGRITKPHESQMKLVTEVKDRTYVNKYISNRGKEHKKISYGYEIIKELNVCSNCYNPDEDLVIQRKKEKEEMEMEEWKMNY